MTDIEQIDDELRNYKLFKIQKSNTKIQKYSEIHDDLKKSKKFNSFYNMLSYINYVIIIFFIFLLLGHLMDLNTNNEKYLYLLLLVILSISAFQSFQNIILRKKFSSFEKSIIETIDHFKDESEKQKSNYEFFIEKLQETELKLKKFK